VTPEKVDRFRYRLVNPCPILRICDIRGLLLIGLAVRTVLGIVNESPGIENSFYSLDDL
jgi:hypothetical protein